jgi:hypothetical protein
VPQVRALVSRSQRVPPQDLCGAVVNCTRCETTGFLNLHQVAADVIARANGGDFHAAISTWITENADHDVQVCDCCGDGEEWHCEAGEHDEGQYGKSGPYAYNGGLPECW